MGKLMQWMQGELEGIGAADVKAPEFSVAVGEEVLGTLTDLYLQKLWVLGERLSNELATLAKEPAHKRNTITLSEKKDVVYTLFWTGLRHELSEDALVRFDKECSMIGIRKGWEIVACRKPQFSLPAVLLAFGPRIPIPG